LALYSFLVDISAEHRTLASLNILHCLLEV
jgi:hypothetical protein